MPNWRHSVISIDITPQVSSSKMLLQSYGEGGFRVSNAGRLEGSHLIFSEKILPWPVSDASDINLESLKPILCEANSIDILIVGCGLVFKSIPDDLRTDLREHGIVLEWMDTGAACRTFNVLLVEERLVAAALLAVD